MKKAKINGVVDDPIKEDLFIPLQLEDASDEINKLLGKFDLVLRVDEETNEYSCFAIENFEEREVSVAYYPLEGEE